MSQFTMTHQHKTKNSYFKAETKNLSADCLYFVENIVSDVLWKFHVIKMATLEISERVIFDDKYVMINGDVTFLWKGEMNLSETLYTRDIILYPMD